MTAPTDPWTQTTLAGPEPTDPAEIEARLDALEARLVILEDENAMRVALERIFTQLPDALTIQSLYDGLISAGGYMLAERQGHYPLPENGKFRALLDDDEIWWNLAAIGTMIPMFDAARGNAWSDEREDDWDRVVDATYEVFHELWEQNPFHVWYGEELLQAIQERLLQKITILQLSMPNIALLKAMAQDAQHPYARLLTYMLKICCDYADKKIFGVAEPSGPDALGKAEPTSGLMRLFSKLRGKSKTS